MPGHVKKSTGPDPDPTEYLYVSVEMKEQDQAKPYDSKKSCWVSDPKDGYIEGEIQGTKGDLTTVTARGETKDWKKDQVHQVNPPKYEKCEDMSNLTYLNDPSVLYNLKARYVNKLIYTYSGLFCIAVNPYKRYPIYTNRVVKIYQGKRRNEVPPHIFAIADGAYMDMMQVGQNQSMLITGESGAGKTENTKKVLSYFANVGATTKKKKEGEKERPNLEDQIIQTNPVLEAFGNAKTVRNDNSSRFGKFIRIHFQPNGKLSGGDIEVYLLEKARVISQQSLERSYHIFYEIMSDQIKEIKPLCLLSDDIYDYLYVSQGKVTVPSIDDAEDMQFCHDAFDVLGFSKQEVENVYKITATVMHMGEMRFKQRGREEQAEPEGTQVGERVAKLLGVDSSDLYKNITKPKIKVGAEFVAKGMNKDQCFYSVGALAKALYERVFKFLVSKCNETLETGLKRACFIGVLDIAGFEIFDFNGFEQICINFCNEKLQQFFNHHMFVLEQEEYKKEGINWVFVDFGMDLQACIELFERKMGILSILEEESMFPKATDKSFAEKLNANHLGKTPVFIKPKPPKPGQADAHFAVVHYAGTVSYNLSGWLEKNKDPLNDTVVDQLKKATNELTVLIFADHPGQSGAAADTKGGRGQKSGSFKTVSSGYRDQLNNLMRTLNATHPHFIRCIVPNETKSPGVIDAGLIMHQLTCNGVLEGIRICRKGFPNRMPYLDFRHRYLIIAAQEMTAAKDDKKAAKVCFDKAGLSAELYRLGKTKVFFRAGALGTLEEVRDERIGGMVAWLQAWVRGYIGRQSYKKLQEQRVALEVVQRSLRKFLQMRTWPWYNLWQKVKPLLNVTRIEDEMKALEDKLAKSEADYENEVKLRRELEAANLTLVEEKNNLLVSLDSTKGNMSEFIEKEKKFKIQKSEMEEQLSELSERLEKEDKVRTQLTQDKKKVEQDVSSLKKDVNGLESVIQQGELHKADKDHQIRSLREDVTHNEELFTKVTKEKKQLQECNQKMAEDLQTVEDKCTHLNNIKTKLEQTLDELEDELRSEKQRRGESDKVRRRVEGDLKLTQETMIELERSRKDLETTIQRKDKEVAELARKLDGEQGNVAKFKKSVKELEAHIQGLEHELQHEHEVRVRLETNKGKLMHELCETGERLEEAGGATAAQIELNKKREAELARLRMQLEDNKTKHESVLSNLRKKHSDTVGEMSDQMMTLNKAKARAETEKEELKNSLDEAKMSQDLLRQEKNATEKTNKQLVHQMKEVSVRLEGATRTVNEYNVTKKKLAVENTDLVHQLEETEAKMGEVNTLKLSLANQLLEAKKMANDEARSRIDILGKYRNLELDADGLREQLDEEIEVKGELERQLNKAVSEAQMWRAKFESEGLVRCETLEAERSKLLARLDEAEAHILQLNAKNINLEKNKVRINTELEQVQLDIDRAQTMAAASEKRQKNFDRVASEWKVKIDDLTRELSNCQKQCRNYSIEMFQMKTINDQTLEQLEDSRRDNKNLASQIKDLTSQIGDGDRSLFEVETNSRRLEAEKEELHSALEETEAALEQQENKTLRMQVELTQAKQEMEGRLQEKEEEFCATRKSHQRAVESLQSSLEAESKSKAEAIRMKLKMETDIHDLEAALDNSNRANSDLQKHIKKLETELSELQQRMDGVQAKYSQLLKENAATDRRLNTLTSELEECRSLLDKSDRNRRQAQEELTTACSHNEKLNTENGNLTLVKRKHEADLVTLQAEVDDAVTQKRSLEDRAKKALLDATRLADELRAEQEHAQTQEKMRKGLEVTVKELQVRLKESDEILQTAGRATVNKLEKRIKELENQLHFEVANLSEAQNDNNKYEKQVMEFSYQADEDKRVRAQMQDVVDKMQQKVKKYKSQIEEAEEIAALNLAKYRKAQQELDYFHQATNTVTLVQKTFSQSVV
ncbi:hypothetical protein Pmani_011728 [Petrolisthes manimaculis]|uniref:Myosin heavy chain n=1 Tax=Petrolisthes manimaculis TaxID=1843537 RepID=A0AAE1UFE0_9EUCA|nr:hypothetical protein Pmani_011728 [Petrolisthes manimaculis]